MVARLKALEESAAPLVAFLQNPNAVQELRADKQYNLQMLNDRYQVCLSLNLLLKAIPFVALACRNVCLMCILFRKLYPHFDFWVV